MDLKNIMRPKKDEDLFKFAERGDLDAFLSAIPESAKSQRPPGKPEIPKESSSKRFTILQKASDGLSSLLKKEFDVNLQNESGHTLLHVAALNGHVAFVERLVGMGAETLAKDATGNTPLHLATWSGHPAVVQVLLKNGSLFNEVNHEGSAPLHFAAQYGKDKQCAQILLEHGANVVLRNRANETPLDLAARFGKAEIAQLLASQDTIQQIYPKNERPKCSPLHLAARSGHREICGMLLDAGVKIDCLNAEGATALHEATQFGKRDVVLLLLQSGANPKITNDVSQNPLDLLNTFNAKAQGNVIQQLLQAALDGVERSKLADISTTAIASTSGEEIKAKAKSSKIKARAVIAYAGSAYDPSVLSFEIGDIIWVNDQSASGWWKGTLEKSGLTGDFKANYVEVISDKSGEAEEPAAEPEVQKRYPPKPQGPGVATQINHTRSKSDGSDMSDYSEGLVITAETTVEQWLLSLKLERYLMNFTTKGYSHLRDVRLMDAAQLEAIGIQLAGHRKKFLIAIEKIPYFPVSAEVRAQRSKSSAALDDLLNEMGGDLSKLAASPVPSTTPNIASHIALPPPLEPASPLTTTPISFKNLPKPPPPVAAAPAMAAPLAQTTAASADVSFDDLDGMLAQMEADIEDI